MKRLIVLLALAMLMVGTTSANDEAFQETLKIGRGDIHDVQWHPDGTNFLVSTVRGTWFYTPTSEGRIDEVASLDGIRLGRYNVDGRLLAGVDGDSTIRVWDVADFSYRHDLIGHTRHIDQLTWSPDDTRLATLDRSGRVIVWDAANQTQLLDLRLQDANRLLWSKDGSYLAAHHTLTGNFTVWDRDGAVVFTPSNPLPGWLLWRNDTQILARWSSEVPEGILWDIETGEAQQLGSVGYVTAFSPDGERLAAAGAIGAAIIDVDTWEAPHYITEPVAGTASWSPDGEMVVFGDWNGDVNADNYITIMDSGTGDITGRLERRFPITGIHWHPDGEGFVIVDQANQFAYESVTQGIPSTRYNRTYTAVGDIAAWRDDGELIAIADADYGARLWDTTTGTQLRSRVYLGSSATKLAWQPGGTMLAAATGDPWQSVTTDVVVRDTIEQTEEGFVHAMIVPHLDLIADIAWTPDGKTLASAEIDQYIRLWSPGERNVIRIIDLGDIRHGRPGDATAQKIYSLHWSTNGDQLGYSFFSSGNPGDVWIVDLNENTIIHDGTPANRGVPWTWTADNEFVWVRWIPRDAVYEGERTHDILLQNLDSREPIATFTGLQTHVANAIFSPDASRLVGFDAEGNAIVWAVDTQEQVTAFDNTTHAVWSPDSQLLAVFGSDGRIRIIDAQSGEMLKTFGERHHVVTPWRFTNHPYVTWSADSTRIALLDHGVLTIYDR